MRLRWRRTHPKTPLHELDRQRRLRAEATEKAGNEMESVPTCSYCDEPATHRLKFARDKPLCQTHLDKIRKAAVDDAMREFDGVFEKGE